MYEFSGGKTKKLYCGGAEGNAAAISHEEKNRGHRQRYRNSPSQALAQFAMRRDGVGTPDREPSSPIHFNSS